MTVSNERARLDALYQLNLLDTPASESFDRITRMASQLFKLPIAAVSLTDHDRQWFKSRVGIAHDAVTRTKAPCSQVAETTDTLVIPDLLDNAFYRDCPIAQDGIRFYAGAPLVTRDGHGLGALCVLGTEPRNIDPKEIAALNDLAAMVMSQIELQHAFGRIDPLSGLPNRTQFLDDIADLGRDKPGERRLAIMLDLARPEQINNMVRVMGPSHVDDMVRKAAQQLREILPAGRTAYHVAATQFAYLADPDMSDDAYAAMLEGMLKRSRAELTVQLVSTMAVGIAPFMVGETDPRDVLRLTHSAAQDARGSETSVSLYSIKSDGAHRRRFGLLRDFENALAAHDQLRLVYQPRVDLASRACVGAEALLRWQHPTLGDVSPSEFIPIVERSSLARPLTQWVLDHALGQLKNWSRVGLRMPLSVNISAANLEESDFAPSVQLLLLKHGIRPELLELELTESAVMENIGPALDQLNTLYGAGIKLAIDDFGTGYSSLAYLQRLPAQVLKIDQGFIRGVLDGEREMQLVRSMIILSHDLGFHTVAEGVETTELAELLETMGCDEAQGYLFTRPLEPAAFVAWIEDWNAATLAQAVG
ncbi:sensor domain-containing phosphodiesterase [Sphingomonas sp. CARO-RG-8B-R24-01]|uniref:sensor domain-containing phosphodiesterase n=1 Tax=Sphingomonas sp. CARO-RG-8B-R24-01 TaxID=2914831 RepID=UPI001F5816E9|nr:sensor domain-containing phosphodiesterase [Sphingomonas sp. CARO-RG-8B-R24-01]